jgi:hypothetical protein
VDTVVLDTAEDLVELLERFQPDPLERHVALLATDAMRSYLRMNASRSSSSC